MDFFVKLFHKAGSMWHPDRSRCHHLWPVAAVLSLNVHLPFAVPTQATAASHPVSALSARPASCESPVLIDPVYQLAHQSATPVSSDPAE